MTQLIYSIKFEGAIFSFPFPNFDILIPVPCFYRLPPQETTSSRSSKMKALIVGFHTAVALVQQRDSPFGDILSQYSLDTETYM